jgi:ATP-dependent RNA helicase RhlE
LNQRGILSDEIHGNKSQNARQTALNNFKLGKVRVLVATDVASRGIDVSDVTHVINYEVPQTFDSYIHRIGRTGRAGKKGVALTFVS